MSYHWTQAKNSADFRQMLSHFHFGQDFEAREVKHKTLNINTSLDGQV